MFQNFSYDPNGNRLTLNQEVNKTISYLYKEKSNILQTIAHYKRVDENNTQKEKEITLSYDKAGNIIGDDKHIYTYDAKNRLIKIDNNITYTYNYKNQRVSKTINNKTTYFIYDDYKLIGEYNEDGIAIKEYIYLDDTPIAIIENNKVYYIYADHLNTPRRVATSDTNKIVWKWESKPFGEDKPTGTYELNLRFPGQYFDKESGFSYNINRYYNPTLGRYMQSDPIGLDGGENTYLYADVNPLVKYDESGLRAPNLVPPGINIYADAQEAMNMSSAEFYNAVKSGGKWDFKRLNRKYEDYGNYHFGWVAEAFGLPQTVALMGAGAYRIKSGTSKLEWYGTYFDDPNDQHWIKEGYKDRPGEWTDRLETTAQATIMYIVDSWF